MKSVSAPLEVERVALITNGKRSAFELDVRMALAGNYCRDGAYPSIEKVMLAFSAK